MGNNVDIITDYREAKKKAEQLAVAARKQMQGRYLALLTEAADILTEFKQSFEELPELPPTVKTFSLAAPGTPANQPKSEPSEAAALGKKIGGLRRSLAAAIRKQDGTRVDEISAQLKTLGIDTGLIQPDPLAAPTTEPPAAPEVNGHDAGVEFDA